MAPSGRKRYPHWSQIVTIEEVFDLPPTDPPNYIDKRSGIPEPEVVQEVERLRQEYRNKYMITNKSKLSKVDSDKPQK